jgi:hypothetical protein
MKPHFETIIRLLAEMEKGSESLSKVNIIAQFNPEEGGKIAVAKNLNAAFLIALSGTEHHLYPQARANLDNFQSRGSLGALARFYKDGLQYISTEISERYSCDSRFQDNIHDLYAWVTKPENLKKKQKTAEKFHRLFFPEGVPLADRNRRSEKIKQLREKRKIRIQRLNPFPIANPAREILFTSNILVTLPPDAEYIEMLDINDKLKDTLKLIKKEEQLYWYDHPIPVGTDPEHNEALYGLKGMDEAVKFEKQRGIVKEDARVDCLLSASVTHRGLQKIIREYLEHELQKEKGIQHLNIYILTDAECTRLVDEVFIPAVEEYLHIREAEFLHEIIGVDGEYGRHYSLLKALAAFWQVFMNKTIKGTFKIDLDQVFPQKELVEQTGYSAFEHLQTPLWGAEGIDNQGNSIELGMIAGVLVNKEDIKDSLRTPDVRFPPEEARADELIFFSRLTQALSTEAEMMTLYTEGGIDGKTECIHRIHVTGGTTGILVDSLKRYRPFTPTFIGRAEDQAYILSVLLQDHDKYLRYIHKDGLIMRHDKNAFAQEAIKLATKGKLVGDYVRILLFSYFVHALPWSGEAIKQVIDPFTGCFVSKIPLTVVYMRLALKAASFFSEHRHEQDKQGFEFLQIGISRLEKTMQKLTKKPNPLIEQYLREKRSWDLYYDILGIIEEKIKEGDIFARTLQKKAKSIIKECKIKFEN